MRDAAQRPALPGEGEDALHDLFSFCGVAAPSRPACDLARQSVCASVVSTGHGKVIDLASRIGPRQLVLTMNYPAISNIVSLVSRRSTAYLDYCVLDFFSDIREVQETARGLEGAGIYFIGQLVQLSAKDLLSLNCTTPGALDAVEVRLAEVGLRLGMVLPSTAFDPDIPAALRL